MVSACIGRGIYHQGTKSTKKNTIAFLNVVGALVVGYRCAQNGIGLPSRWKRSIVSAILAARSRIISRSPGKLKVLRVDDDSATHAPSARPSPVGRGGKARAMQTIPTG